jgi:hypothetical protein
VTPGHRGPFSEATFRRHAHLELQHLYVKAKDFEFPVESDLDQLAGYIHQLREAARVARAGGFGIRGSPLREVA